MSATGDTNRKKVRDHGFDQVGTRIVETGTSAAARGAGIGAAVLGLATAVTVWLLRRRARRNTGPWRTAVRTAKAQIKNARRDARAGLKAARKRSEAQAAAKVAAAKAKARTTRAKAGF